jgi:hypothetical protein
VILSTTGGSPLPLLLVLRALPPALVVMPAGPLLP